MGSEDGIGKSEFVAKTQILLIFNLPNFSKLELFVSLSIIFMNLDKIGSMR